jgi:hypothetical protein
MSKRVAKDPSRSIWAKLVARSKDRGEDPNYVLLRFSGERLLYRLSVSAHAGRFVLKGAMLFAAWTERPHRTTKDVDLLGYGDPDQLVSVFREICALEVAPDDGLRFDASSIRLENIREDEEYDGRRILMKGTLGKLHTSVQVDIGFGDVVTPGTIDLAYPVLLDQLPSPRLRTYPPETVIAEKFEAMVKLGQGNSRMKDFYDVWVLSRSHSFTAGGLMEAVRATFERRGTDLPDADPIALTTAFATDPTKLSQLRAFLARTRAMEEAPLEEVVKRLLALLSPLYSRPLTSHQSAWSPAKGEWS